MENLTYSELEAFFLDHNNTPSNWEIVGSEPRFKTVYRHLTQNYYAIIFDNQLDRSSWQNEADALTEAKFSSHAQSCLLRIQGRTKEATNIFYREYPDLGRAGYIVPDLGKSLTTLFIDYLLSGLDEKRKPTTEYQYHNYVRALLELNNMGITHGDAGYYNIVVTDSGDLTAIDITFDNGKFSNYQLMISNIVNAAVNINFTINSIPEEIRNEESMRILGNSHEIDLFIRSCIYCFKYRDEEELAPGGLVNLGIRNIISISESLHVLDLNNRFLIMELSETGAIYIDKIKSILSEFEIMFNTELSGDNFGILCSAILNSDYIEKLKLLINE